MSVLDFSYMAQLAPYLLTKLPITLGMASAGMLCALVLASLLAVIRVTRPPVLNPPTLRFISFFRGTPLAFPGNHTDGAGISKPPAGYQPVFGVCRRSSPVRVSLSVHRQRQVRGRGSWSVPGGRPKTAVTGPVDALRGYR